MAKALKQYKPTNEPWWQKELAHEEQEVLEISDITPMQFSFNPLMVNAVAIF
jgi:hypothetical protein